MNSGRTGIGPFTPEEYVTDGKAAGSDLITAELLKRISATIAKSQSEKKRPINQMGQAV